MALVTGLRFATIACVGVLEIFYKIILLQVESLAWATVKTVAGEYAYNVGRESRYIVDRRPSPDSQTVQWVRGRGGTSSTRCECTFWYNSFGAAC